MEEAFRDRSLLSGSLVGAATAAFALPCVAGSDRPASCPDRDVSYMFHTLQCSLNGPVRTSLWGKPHAEDFICKRLTRSAVEL